MEINLHTTTTVPDHIVQDIVTRIVTVARPRTVILFGSAARGDFGPNSDLDFLVGEGQEVRPLRSLIQPHPELP